MTTVSASYFVYDPEPIGPEWPTLVGPFATEAAAAEYANAAHPDDGSGSAIVLRAVEPSS